MTDQWLFKPQSIFWSRATKKILGMNPMPDGVFSAVDEAAAGAMKALRRAGVQIPRDMAFIGFSDSPVCTLVEPALSSVSQSPLEMGLSAAKQMLGRLRDTCVEKEICVKSELVLRESSLRGRALMIFMLSPLSVFLYIKNGRYRYSAFL